MCDPATALVVAGGAVAAAGAVQGGIAANQQARFQAQVANNNAIIARRAAADARERGEAAARQRGVAGAQLAARQRVAAAALGQDVGAGSIVDLLGDTAAATALDEATLRNNAEREALDFMTRATTFESEAQLARARGNSALTAGVISGLGTALTTGSTVHDRWLSRSAAAGARVPQTDGNFVEFS